MRDTLLEALHATLLENKRVLSTSYTLGIRLGRLWFINFLGQRDAWKSQRGVGGLVGVECTLDIDSVKHFLLVVWGGQWPQDVLTWKTLVNTVHFRVRHVLPVHLRCRFCGAWVDGIYDGSFLNRYGCTFVHRPHQRRINDIRHRPLVVIVFPCVKRIPTVGPFSILMVCLDLLLSKWAKGHVLLLIHKSHA